MQSATATEQSVAKCEILLCITKAWFIWIILLYGGTLIWRDPKETVIWQPYMKSVIWQTLFKSNCNYADSKGKLKNAPYKMDNFSKLKQFKIKS